MATNKRKDAASLFELIGKSTLKVPKDAGSLKVPAWWNTRANPAVPAPEAPDALPPAESTTSGAAVNHAVATANGALNGATNGAAESSHETPETTTLPIPFAVPRPVVRPPRDAGIFAPQTMDPQRMSRRQPSLQMVPRWAIVAACLLLLLFAVLVVVVVHHFTQSPSPSSSTDTTSAVTINPQPHDTIPASRQPPSPGANQNANGNTPTGPAKNNAAPPPPQPKPPEPVIQPGRVVPAAEVQRVAGMKYLVILSTPTPRVALANADFLVQHGMSDITIEQKTNGMYSVISVQGFTRLDDPMADALRKKAIEIGKEHPDFKKQHRSVYYDAYYKTIARAPAK